MRIAILNKYQNKVSRGAETFVSELSKRLAKRHEVEVISNVNYLDLLKNKYEIVIPTNGRFQVIITRIITWLKKSKMIVSGQSGAGLDDRINLYTFPNVFVALSEYQKKWAERVNPFVKVVKISNGVDLEKFTLTGSPLKGVKKERIVLSVGAFTKEKRHDLTIKAVSKLENVKLIIVGGGGDLMTDIKILGEKILSDRFEILSVNHSDMPKIYRRASVLAFPTVPWESFGIVLVEAMASNVPVVATNDPIRKEIVGDAGILIDPTNVGEYAKALENAMNKNWKNLPRRQAEKFSWNNIAENYENLFQNIFQ